MSVKISWNLPEISIRNRLEIWWAGSVDTVRNDAWNYEDVIGDITRKSFLQQVRDLWVGHHFVHYVMFATIMFIVLKTENLRTNKNFVSCCTFLKVLRSWADLPLYDSELQTEGAANTESWLLLSIFVWSIVCQLLCINHRRSKRTAKRTDSDSVVEGVLFGEFLSIVDSILFLQLSEGAVF